MKLRSIKSVRNLNGKRVMLRVDLNVSLKTGHFEPSDVWKLQSIIPTITYLRKKKAKILLISSRGRPHGRDHDLTLAPIVTKLGRMIDTKIEFWKYLNLEVCAERSKKMKQGDIACLENIRFHGEEYSNNALFARKLAQCADIYVNDAFANIHRTHASMVAITRYLPSYAGLLLEYEVKHLDGLLKRAKRPIVAIMGGNKISTKIRLIKKLLRKVDWLLMGGALANNVLAAMNYAIGRSMVEEDMISWSKGILHNKLKVPLDARVASTLRSQTTRIAAIGAVRNKEMILDLGPDTISFYAGIIMRAKTVIWNGPLGYFEDPRFAIATRKLVRALAKSKARSYVGGGETVKAVLAEHVEKDIDFVSTGGGAMLTLLEGKPLPALRALRT